MHQRTIVRSQLAHSMLSAAQVKAFAERKWPELLRADVAGQSVFPLNVRLGRPPTTGDFSEIRGEAATLASQAKGWRIEWDEVQTRKWGRQRWPARIVFDSIEDVALTLGRERELRQVRTALRELREKLPALEAWACTNAHRLAEHASYWADLLAVCTYFDANPQPRCYPRQISAAPDTKFVEQHEVILGEMLDAVLGDRANGDGKTFAEKFHLLSEPPQLRFRFLDEKLQARVGWPVDDCVVSTASFACLTWRIPRVVIVENRTVFLCLPRLTDAIGIWGAGKAASLLASCDWLRRADVVYWGDCDEAGLGILSALRERFPHVRSILMDGIAWRAWSHLASRGKRDVGATHSHLADEERDVLQAVLSGPFVLEQERIPSAVADAAIFKAFENRSVGDATRAGSRELRP